MSLVSVYGYNRGALDNSKDIRTVRENPLVRWSIDAAPFEIREYLGGTSNINVRSC